MIKHVFIDMDGVLSNWLDAACEALNLDVKNKEIRQKTKDGIWLDEMGFFTEEEMWDVIKPKGTDWWANLSIYPWATHLINEMKEFGEIHFLTSPGLCEMAPTGKMQWIMKYFGKAYLKQLIIAKHKYLLAGPDRILIDDSDRRLQEFIDEGGYGFLWPGPFSIEDGDIPIDDVMESLTDVIEIRNNSSSKVTVDKDVPGCNGSWCVPSGARMAWDTICAEEDDVLNKTEKSSKIVKAKVTKISKGTFRLIDKDEDILTEIE